MKVVSFQLPVTRSEKDFADQKTYRNATSSACVDKLSEEWS